MGSVLRPYQGFKSRLALAYVASTDLYNGDTPTNNTYVDIFADQSFEVKYPGSIILVNVRGHLFINNVTVSNEHASFALIDGTTRYSLGNGYGVYHNAFAGHSMLAITGLGVGTHTIRLQTYGATGGPATYYCRASTLPNLEPLFMGVFELASWTHPRRRGYQGMQARLALDSVVTADTSFALTASAYNDIIPDQAFTILDPNSLLLTLVNMGSVDSLGASAQVTVFAMFDSTTRYLLGGDMGDVGAMCSFLTSSGPRLFASSDLGVGSHNVKIQAYPNAAATHNCRATALAPYEHKRVQVLELR